MKISCLQMDMRLGDEAYNYAHAVELVREAVRRDGADTVVLPETWNTGYFPEDLSAHADRNGERTKAVFSLLAKELNIHIVCGSVANRRDDGFYNTAYVFDRTGSCIAEYDKTHLFTYAKEHQHFHPGGHTCRFQLDGVDCGLIICYDLRFPELTRRLSLDGIEMLFVVSQWPEERIAHLRCLTAARAIENQIFVVNCNSCSSADSTVYGGTSAVIDPLGRTLALAGKKEEILSAECHTNLTEKIRDSIPVFRDRHPGLYET